MSCWDEREVLINRVWMSAAALAQLHQQQVAVAMSRLTSSLLRSARMPVTPLACCEQLAQLPSRDAMVLGQPAQAVERGLDVRRAVLERRSRACPATSRAASVSICSVVVARSLKASTTSYAGDGPRQRDLAGAQVARAGRLEREVLLPQDRLHPHAGRGLGAEVGGSVTLKSTTHVVAVQVDLLHLADLDPGDPHVVAGLEAAGLGERGRVGRRRADERQVARC